MGRLQIIQVGLKCHHNGLEERGRGRFNTQGQEKTMGKKETEIGKMQPQVIEEGRDKEWILHWSFQKEQLYQHLDLRQ